MSQKKKKWLGTIIKIAVSAVLLAILIHSTDLTRIAAALKGFRFIWLIPAFGAILLSVVLSALKWSMLLKAQGIPVPPLRLFLDYLAGLFFNNFLPSSIGGDGARIVLAGQDCGSYSGAAASVVMERILATVTLALLGLASAIFATDPNTLAVVLMAGLFVVGSVLAAIQMTGWVPKRLRASDKKFAGAWRSFAENSTELRKKPKAIVLCLALSVLFQMTVAFVIGAIIGGLHLPALPLADLFLVVSASSVLAMVPVGLNGYGLREGTYAYLLKPFGFTTAQALTVSVLFALFVSIFSLSGGFVWLAKRPKKGTDDVAPPKPDTDFEKCECVHEEL